MSRFASYDEYLNSPEWRSIRARCFKRDDFRCVRCGSAVNIQAHHVEYPEPYGEFENTTLDMLVTLCKKCHNELHHAARYEYVNEANANFICSMFGDHVSVGGDINLCSLIEIKKYWEMVQNAHHPQYTRIQSFFAWVDAMAWKEAVEEGRHRELELRKSCNWSSSKINKLREKLELYAVHSTDPVTYYVQLCKEAERAYSALCEYKEKGYVVPSTVMW